MLDGMSLLCASLARRLKLRRVKKKIASSAKPPFFSCDHTGTGNLSPFFRPNKLKKLTGKGTSRPMSTRVDEVEGDHDDGHNKGDGVSCVWRRTILLGQKCQPLEFAGAIHYDSEGQRLRQVRQPPRSPVMSPARSFGSGYLDRA